MNALGRFLETEDGKSLVAGFKRAANILRAEEKKDGEGAFEAAAEPGLCREPVEAALLDALSRAGEAAGIALGGRISKGRCAPWQRCAARSMPSSRR